MARQEILRINRTIKAPLEAIDGTYNGEYGDAEWIPLSLALLRIWEKIVDENLDAAWVFEDDVIFHDDFNDLFPLYWEKVPEDYEVVYVGHNPWNTRSCLKNSSVMLHSHLETYTTHAMIISRAGAARLSRAMRGIFDMAKRLGRTPAPEEGRADVFLNLIRASFLPEEEKHKYVAFDSTKEHLSKWGGISWCETPDLWGSGGWDCCEKCDVELSRQKFSVPMPVVGTGLAYQHHCKSRPEDLKRWRQE